MGRMLVTTRPDARAMQAFINSSSRCLIGYPRQWTASHWVHSQTKTRPFWAVHYHTAGQCLTWRQVQWAKGCLQ
jgi:hypothetical protein